MMLKKRKLHELPYTQVENSGTMRLASGEQRWFFRVFFFFNNLIFL